MGTKFLSCPHHNTAGLLTCRRDWMPNTFRVTAARTAHRLPSVLWIDKALRQRLAQCSVKRPDDTQVVRTRSASIPKGEILDADSGGVLLFRAKNLARVAIRGRAEDPVLQRTGGGSAGR